jgi:23S rRNA G2069 N7-methylase RlmK/C1962 C5-methylase RlmI
MVPALAVETAAENARANGFGLDAGRVSFVKADVLDFIRGQLQQLQQQAKLLPSPVPPLQLK